MADTTHKTQVNVLLSHEAHHLLRQLYEAKIKELGAPISLGVYMETLVSQEAKRKGIKAKRGKPA